MATGEKAQAKVEDLRLDLRNPRSGGEEFDSEEAALRFLIDHADVKELVSSILAAGWIEFEPLIVEKGTNVVLEGNRRLAALRLLGDEGLRRSLEFDVGTDQVVGLPTEVSVLRVNSREDARSYIAFKHINGPAKWDALAKAKYADEWVTSGVDLKVVSKSIGDTHNTVLRLVNGHRVLLQATHDGFDLADITARRFNFSHLYTAIARPSIRNYLGLPEDVSVLLDSHPVPDTFLENLHTLMGWLYGQGKRGVEHVVKSQNPDLNLLVKVVANQQAMGILVGHRNLRAAVEVIDPPSNRFTEALRSAAFAGERALGLVSHFDPESQASLLGTIKSLANTVRTMRDAMTAKAAGGGDL